MHSNHSHHNYDVRQYPLLLSRINFMMCVVETKKGKKNMRILKAHTYHVLASAGVFTEIANFPRGLDDPRSQRIVKFVREHTAAHRLATKYEITELVRTRDN